MLRSDMAPLLKENSWLLHIRWTTLGSLGHEEPAYSHMGLSSLCSGLQPPLYSEDLQSVWSTSMWSHTTAWSGNALFSKGNARENLWPCYLLVITLAALKGFWPHKALQWTVEDTAGVTAWRQQSTGWSAILQSVVYALNQISFNDAIFPK